MSGPDADDTDAAVDDLFAGPPEEFVAHRDALVKRLKAAGDKAVAAEVKALRRPTAAARALNLLARHRPDDVGDLRAVGAALRSAQQAALRGDGGGDLREAMAERRRAVESLTAAALALLEAEGRAGGSQREAVAATLEAAVVDDEVGALLASGRLATDVSGASGFDVLAALSGGLTLVSGSTARERSAGRGDDVDAPASRPNATARGLSAGHGDDVDALESRPDESSVGPASGSEDGDGGGGGSGGEEEEEHGPDPAEVRAREDDLAAARAGAAEADSDLARAEAAVQEATEAEERAARATASARAALEAAEAEEADVAERAAAARAEAESCAAEAERARSEVAAAESALETLRR